MTNKSEDRKTDFECEFKKYLKRLEMNKTFIGLDIESFSWYRKVLGLDKKEGS